MILYRLYVEAMGSSVPPPHNSVLRISLGIEHRIGESVFEKLIHTPANSSTGNSKQNTGPEAFPVASYSVRGVDCTQRIEDTNNVSVGRP